MAWGIEQIDDAIAVGKLHDRGSHGYAALLLQAHPVGGRVAGRLAALHGARHLNGAAEQQQLLGQSGLARVGVRDDGKGASFPYFSCSYIVQFTAYLRLVYTSRTGRPGFVNARLSSNSGPPTGSNRALHQALPHYEGIASVILI